MTKRALIGMAMLLISEAVFFFLLILACVYLRALPHFDARSGWLLTAAFIASSVSIWRGWRWAALALGAVFLIGLFATIISMLTAVLSVFIIAGAIALTVVPLRSLRALALYWYFCTAVWLVIFGVASLA
jgi:heme/copper-type cytochrome/quinol oxidase subunit 3